MVNYQNGKIYKIINTVDNNVYIGSTARALSSRMSSHRYDAKNNCRPNSELYKAINSLGIEQFKIVLIKKYPCADVSELEAEEYRVMNEFQSRGVTLYNAKLTADQNGVNNHNFTRGSIRQRGANWSFEWKVLGKNKSKTFAIKAWGGEWSAKKMAELYQNKIFPERIMA